MLHRLIVAAIAASVCLMAALPAFANHGNRLMITVDRPIAVVVDGEILEFIDGTTRVEVYDIAPGRHLIEFRNMVGRLVDEAEVQVPGGGVVEVRARWKDKQFEQIDTVFLEAPPNSAPTVIVVEEPGHHESVSVSVGVDGPGYGHGLDASVSTTTTSSSTTTTTSAGGLHGGVVVTTTESHESVHVDDGHGAVVIVQEGHSAPPPTRNVTFRITDGSWANIYIDGKLVWEPRAMDEEKTISVTTGEHTLVVKDFMENDTWCKGRLIVDGWTDLIIGVAEESQVEVFNDSNAFHPR